MMDAQELAVNRLNTIMFISADPVVINIVRREKVDLTDGGYKWGDTIDVDPQIMRMIPIGDMMPVVQTPDGFQRQPGYVLLGKFDANMQVWDHFFLNGSEYQIVSPIRPPHTVESRYESKGDVALI